MKLQKKLKVFNSQNHLRMLLRHSTANITAAHFVKMQDCANSPCLHNQFVPIVISDFVYKKSFAPFIMSDAVLALLSSDFEWFLANVIVRIYILLCDIWFAFCFVYLTSCQLLYAPWIVRCVSMLYSSMFRVLILVLARVNCLVGYSVPSLCYSFAVPVCAPWYFFCLPVLLDWDYIHKNDNNDFFLF
jgi:sensor histidine kinase YesM